MAKGTFSYYSNNESRVKDQSGKLLTGKFLDYCCTIWYINKYNKQRKEANNL